MSEKEYIERDGLVGLFLEKCFKDTQSTITYGDVIQIINAYHRADVQEVRHGKWLINKNMRECSECGYFYYSNNVNTNYCCNCGAKMDKE